MEGETLPKEKHLNIILPHNVHKYFQQKSHHSYIQLILYFISNYTKESINKFHKNECLTSMYS